MSETKTVLILGGSGGIGSAVARRLAAAGTQIVLAGRNEASLKERGAELGAQTHVLDARDPAAIRALAKETAKTYERLDGIVNCVGSILLKPAHLTKPEELADTVATNLNSAFGAVQAAADTMRKTGGSVVLMSSAAARTGLSNHEAIAAAKAAVAGLTRSAAATYASWGIRINAVAPGLVDSPLTERLTSNAASLEVSNAMHPLGRIGTTDEVASAVLWLLDQSWVTGQVIGVDGGLATVRPKKA